MTRLRASWEYLRGTYWALPSAMSVIAVLLSIGMIQLDRAVTARLLDQLSWVYTGGPEGARAVLSTIAGSMITVAGVTFSITIVALTLASQQFGPRLLRNFLGDLGNQVVLGTFVSTFLYCLLVLRTVRGSDDEEFVPAIGCCEGRVVTVQRQGIGRIDDRVHPPRTSVGDAEGISVAGHILMGKGHQTSLSADDRGLVVAEVQPSLPWTGFLDFHGEDAFAALVAGSEFGVDPLDTRVSLEQLQPFLDRRKFQRRVRAQGYAVAQVASPKPISSLHVDS